MNFVTGAVFAEDAASGCAEGWTISAAASLRAPCTRSCGGRHRRFRLGRSGRYTGRHEALVSRETWDRVRPHRQAVETRTAPHPHDFTFTGLPRCGHCGCQLVGELKKCKLSSTTIATATTKVRWLHTREEAMRSFSRRCGLGHSGLAQFTWLNEAVSELLI